MGRCKCPVGVIHRRGLGKTRHIDTGPLWVQQTAAEKRLSFHKVLGKINPADLYTKYLDEATIAKHIDTLAHEFTTGARQISTKLALIGTTNTRCTRRRVDCMECIEWQQKFDETWPKENFDKWIGHCKDSQRVGGMQVVKKKVAKQDDTNCQNQFHVQR